MRVFFAMTAALLAALAPPRAGAEPAYSVASAVVHSSTSGIAQDLPATLLKPDGDGPFPAVVILHDCSGLGARSSGSPKRWSAILAAEGYVVLIPDSFQPRGFADGVCTVQPQGSQLVKVAPAARATDAYAALALLRTLPYVDGKRVAVMGGSHGGSAALATLAAPAGADRFAAGVALYPGCAATYGGWWVTRQAGNRGPVTQFNGTYAPAAPLLILIGAEDDWTPAEHCRALAERSAAAGYPVAIKIYPGARHAFDGAFPTRYVDARNNANKPEGHGATTGGDPVAWADAIVQVKAFLAARLKGQK
ncbi:MAG TPA: dienelactone hydrolase family protein [Stellaceae bacterium]|nr:dienelactone hydrolase family protein [Stellaceae bacterium]